MNPNIMGLMTTGTVQGNDSSASLKEAASITPADQQVVDQWSAAVDASLHWDPTWSPEYVAALIGQYIQKSFEYTFHFCRLIKAARDNMTNPKTRKDSSGNRIPDDFDKVCHLVGIERKTAERMAEVASSKFLINIARKVERNNKQMPVSWQVLHRIATIDQVEEVEIIEVINEHSHLTEKRHIDLLNPKVRSRNAAKSEPPPQGSRRLVTIYVDKLEMEPHREEIDKQLNALDKVQGIFLKDRVDIRKHLKESRDQDRQREIAKILRRAREQLGEVESISDFARKTQDDIRKYKLDSEVERMIGEYQQSRRKALKAKEAALMEEA